MKKKVLIGALVLVLGIGSLVAYADTGRTPNIIPGQGNYNSSLKDSETWFKERAQLRSERVKEALEKGLITEEEAKAWEDHFSYMDEFHNSNGIAPGGCGGFGMGRMGRGMGMMRGHRW